MKSAAELSSIQHVLEDLVRRLGVIAADQHGEPGGEALAQELLAIEGQLLQGQRRLTKLVHRIA